MGLISAFNNTGKAHDSEKSDYKAVLSELSDDPLSATETKKKTTESLLLKAEIINLKEKMTDAAQAIFQL